MRLWQLDPKNLAHRNWRASTYKGRVVIRAETEERARQITTLATAIAVRRIPREDTITPPWSDPEIVACRSIQFEESSERGPEVVLAPAAYDKAWRV